MKLKTNQNFTKGQRTKIKNQKSKEYGPKLKSQ